MKRGLALIVAMSAIVATPIRAADAKAEIVRLENELARAIVDRDVEAVKRIEAEGYVHTDVDAKVAHRDDFIRDYKSGANPIRSLRFDDLVVDVYGDAAVVRGLVAMNETDPHRHSARYTRFYVRTASGWQAVAGQASALKADAK